MSNLKGGSIQAVAMRFFGILWILSLFRPIPALGAGIPAAPDEPRIVAVSDVHGRLEPFRSLLRKVDLIDSQLRWTGHGTTLVVAGDFTDRGPRVRETIDFLMALQQKARRSDGEVVVLLGNHEVMNVTGDFRYVTEETYADFADEKSEERREKAYRDYLAWCRRQARLHDRPLPSHSPELQEDFEESHPLGFFEYVEAFSARGRYGKWIRRLPAVARVGDTLFAHGGIHPDLLEYDLEGLNEKIWSELQGYDRWTRILIRQRVMKSYFTLDQLLDSLQSHVSLLSGDRLSLIWNQTDRDQIIQAIRGLYGMKEWLSLRPDGPLWYRGYASWVGDEEESRLDRVLDRYKAARAVIGHTIVSEKEIVQRFGGKLFLIDTLHPSALVLEGDRITTFYQQEASGYSDSR